MHDYQTTVKSCVTLSGVGVHCGKPVTVRFLPSDPDTGVVFVYNGERGAGRQVSALVSEVGATAFCTVLGSSSGFHVATVEHLMAALFGIGIDNVVVEIDGNEVPVMDGSAEMFVDAIDQAGVEVLDVKRRYIRVVKPVRIDSGASLASAPSFCAKAIVSSRWPKNLSSCERRSSACAGCFAMRPA